MYVLINLLKFAKFQFLSLLPDLRGGFRKFCHRCYNFVNRHNRLLYYALIERATFLLYNDAKTMHEKK